MLNFQGVYLLIPSFSSVPFEGNTLKNPGAAFCTTVARNGRSDNIGQRTHCGDVIHNHPRKGSWVSESLPPQNKRQCNSGAWRKTFTIHLRCEMCSRGLCMLSSVTSLVWVGRRCEKSEERVNFGSRIFHCVVQHFPPSGATSSGLFLFPRFWKHYFFWPVGCKWNLHLQRWSTMDTYIMYIYKWWYDTLKALMISIFEGQSRRLRPKLQPNQGAPFGFQVFFICILILHTWTDSHIFEQDILSLQPLMNTNILST